MITLTDATKTYPNHITALLDVSFGVGKGEFVFVVGESGSGKSTLIKSILREERLSRGRITVDGDDITFMHKKEVPYLRRKMGVVFQDFRLISEKTVYENVAFAMQIAGAGYREVRRSVPVALSLTGLTMKSKVYPHMLSGGEKQRAALARAIVNVPKILLADEPTGNLDPDYAMDIISLLADINARGTTVLVATHERDIVNTMSKRVIRLKKGIIIGDEKGGIYDYAP